ncbi:hypothetical protein GCM10027570_45820 [Streptomonospora sediminis]
MAMRMKESVTIARTDYGSVLLDARSGQYWQLNETGTTIVDMVCQDLDVQAISEHLAAEYEVETGQALSDTAELVESLTEAGLLVPVQDR